MPVNIASVWGDWNWEPSVILGCLALAGLYLGAAGPWRRRWLRSGRLVEAPISKGKIAWFMGGLAVVMFALLSPLDEIGDSYLFSAHMVQHLLLILAAAPMLLLGTPGWMLSLLLRNPTVREAGRWLTNPVVAFLIFNINFAAWHFPALYQATLLDENVHILEHLLFLATAVLNWWPVIGPAEELPRLSPAGQMLYLFLEATPGTVLGGIFVFADSPLYPFYVSAGGLFGISPGVDQQLGGLIMGTVCSLVYLAAMGGVFMAWLDQEDRATVEARAHS